MKQIKSFTKHSPALNAIFREATKYPVLSTEAEKIANPEQLVKHNLLFVVSIAKKYTLDGVDFMDLVSAGMLGLVKASRNYDPTLGFKFCSYAVTKIRGEIIQFIATKRDIIRLPEKMNWVSYYLNTFQKEDESISDTAKRFNISMGSLKVHCGRKKVVSIDAIDDDENELFQVAGDFMTDIRTEKNDQRKVVFEAMKKLNIREQEIIKLRYLSEYQLNFNGVGEKLGLSGERVRQIETIALKKLKIHFSQ